MKNSSSGFTLIELLVVVGIVSLLAVVLAGAYKQAKTNERHVKEFPSQGTFIRAE